MIQLAATDPSAGLQQIGATITNLEGTATIIVAGIVGGGIALVLCVAALMELFGGFHSKYSGHGAQLKQRALGAAVIMIFLIPAVTFGINVVSPMVQQALGVHTPTISGP